MATGMTTVGNYQPELPIQAAEEALSTPQRNLIFSFPAFETDAEANMGDTTRLSRLERLSTEGGRLDGSGVDPAPEVPVRTDVDAQVEIYAKSILVNEQVDLFNSPGTQAKYQLLLGQWVYEKEDQLMRDLLASNVTFDNAIGGTNLDTPTNMSFADYANQEQVLWTNDARTMMESVGAEDKFGTAGQRDAFIGLCHSSLTADLQGVQGVQMKNTYPSKDGVKREEYCQIGAFRMFISSAGIKEANASSLGATVYKMPLTGVEAYLKLRQNGYSTRLGIIPNYAMSNVGQNYGMYAKFAIARAMANLNWIRGLAVTKKVAA